MRRQHIEFEEYDELLARVRDLPPGHRGHILGGKVHVDPPPSPARAHTLAEITAMLVAGSPLTGTVPEGWSFLSNVELAVGSAGLVVADIAGWPLARQELAALASPSHPPAWICEVIDPTTRRFALSSKRQAYAELGVRHLWLADVDAEVLDVLLNVSGRWTLVASLSDGKRIEAPPFEGAAFDADDLWSSTPSTATPMPSSKRRGSA